MPSEEEWNDLIAQAATRRPAATRAVDYRKEPLGSAWAPPLLGCDDGEEYWVKFALVDHGCPATSRTRHLGGIVTDHVVGALARKIAPESVPAIKLVLIGSDLISIEPRLAKACPGPAHGSRNASKNCTNRLPFSHGGYHKLPINRTRVASLAVLYGLCFGGDHQAIFQVGGESLIFSVDHGNFLRDGAGWNAAGLAVAGPAVVDEHIVRECELLPREIEDAIKRLEALVATDLAEAVACPPDEWCFPNPDRIAVASFLWNRRELILQSRI